MSSIPKRLSDVHPQPLRVTSEADRKKVGTAGEADHKRIVGQLVERALELMHLTKQEAAFRMGYSDAGEVSRWCSGLVRPLFDKLLQLDGFEAAWMLALAERSSCVESETVIRIRRRIA